MTTLPPHDLIVTTHSNGRLKVKTTLNPAYLFMQDDVEQIASAWDRGAGDELFKGRNIVRSMKIAGIKTAVKRFKRLSTIKSIIYSGIRESKARRALLYSLEYLRRGIPTPEGIASVEIYDRNLLVDSYFISTLSSGRMLFPELVMAEKYDPAMARRVADFILSMHSSGAINRDPNLKNILVTDTDGTPSLEAIDINRSIFTSKNFNRHQIVRNLARITHRRSLLMLIVERYAINAGLKVQPLIDDVMKALDDIERGRRLRHSLRDAIFR